MYLKFILKHDTYRNAQYKYTDKRVVCFILREDDISVKVKALPLAYSGMHFLYLDKFTMYRPITNNV